MTDESLTIDDVRGIADHIHAANVKHYGDIPVEIARRVALRHHTPQHELDDEVCQIIAFSVSRTHVAADALTLLRELERQAMRPVTRMQV